MESNRAEIAACKLDRTGNLIYDATGISS